MHLSNVRTNVEPICNIDKMFDDAQARVDKMGSELFVEQLYSGGKATHDFKQLKEELLLGFFAQQYNQKHRPALVWACHHAPHTKHADFSIYAENQAYVCDIEMTAVFSKPKTNNPAKYADYSPFPVWRDKVVPSVMHQDIDSSPQVEPYSSLKRIIKSHLRNDYPPYWLVIYDNEMGVRHPNLNQVADRTRAILEPRANRGKLPAALTDVWVFDHHGLIQAYPSAKAQLA